MHSVLEGDYDGRSSLLMVKFLVLRSAKLASILYNFNFDLLLKLYISTYNNVCVYVDKLESTIIYKKKRSTYNLN